MALLNGGEMLDGRSRRAVVCIPLAVAAKAAHTQRQVACVIGDGSVGLNLRSSILRSGTTFPRPLNWILQ